MAEHNLADRPVLLEGKDSEVFQSWHRNAGDSKHQNEFEPIEVLIIFLWHETENCHKPVMMRRGNPGLVNITRIIALLLPKSSDKEEERMRKKQIYKKFKVKSSDHKQTVKGRGIFVGTYIPCDSARECLARNSCLSVLQRLRPLFESLEGDDIDIQKFMDSNGLNNHSSCRKRTVSETPPCESVVVTFRAPQAQMAQDRDQGQWSNSRLEQELDGDSIILRSGPTSSHRMSFDSFSEVPKENVKSSITGTASFTSLALEIPMSPGITASAILDTAETIVGDHCDPSVIEPLAILENFIDVTLGPLDDVETTIVESFRAIREGKKRRKLLATTIDQLIKERPPIEEEIKRYEQLIKTRKEQLQGIDEKVDHNRRELTTADSYVTGKRKAHDQILDDTSN